jgi:hypothetical protein
MENVLHKKNTILVRWILILAVINILGFTFLIGGDRWTNFKSIVVTSIIAFNVLGFILGAIVALFPYKGLRFSDKYLSASLLVVLIIHIITGIWETMMFILNQIGHMRNATH